MLAHDRPVLPYDDAVGVGLDLDWLPTAVDSTEYLLVSNRTVQVFVTEAGTVWKPSKGPR